jgi:hypothetical protein
VEGKNGGRSAEPAIDSQPEVSLRHDNNLLMLFSRLFISPRMRLTSFLMLPISPFSQLMSSSSINVPVRRCLLDGRSESSLRLIISESSLYL